MLGLLIQYEKYLITLSSILNWIKFIKKHFKLILYDFHIHLGSTDNSNACFWKQLKIIDSNLMFNCKLCYALYNIKPISSSLSVHILHLRKLRGSYCFAHSSKWRRLSTSIMSLVATRDTRHFLDVRSNQSLFSSLEMIIISCNEFTDLNKQLRKMSINGVRQKWSMGCKGGSVNIKLELYSTWRVKWGAAFNNHTSLNTQTKRDAVQRKRQRQKQKQKHSDRLKERIRKKQKFVVNEDA